MQIRSRLIFYAGVFSLFSCMGFLTLMMSPIRLTLRHATTAVLISGTFSLLYAAAAVRRRFWLFPVIGVVEAFAFSWLANTYAHSPALIGSDSPMRVQLVQLGVGGILTLVAGYSFFIAFFQREGSRYFRVHTEMALAREIHRALVPKIERSIGRFSMYGASLPSGEVGGDLVDVVEGGSWTAYVADVSGHGVTAGVLMAMFKTAVRTTALAESAPHALLNEVHRALYPLKTPNLFATAAVLNCNSEGALAVAMAGHPPLLHFRRGTRSVEEVQAQDLPLGILPEQTFCSRQIDAEPGDILLLLTDGMTEIFDRKGHEMGIEPIKKALAANAEKPLDQQFELMRQVALKFGRQEDDQTMLLVRVA